MLQGHTMALVPCGNPTPKKLPTGGGEWPTFRTARAQRMVRPPNHQRRINGRYRSTECPRHRHFQPLVWWFSHSSLCPLLG